MQSQKYSATFAKEQLFKYEMKVILTYLLEGKTFEEIRQIVIEQNLFQKRRHEANMQFLGAIYRRANFLDEKLIDIYINGPRYDSLAILLYSFLMSYRLPREFVFEEVRYAYLNNKKIITRGNVKNFIERKEEESYVVNNWSSTTKNKLGSVMLHIISECELITTYNKNEWLVSPLLISKELREYVSSKNYNDFLKLILND